MLDSRQETPGDVAGLRRGLEAADPATLLLSLVQLTGERHWLEEAKPYIRGPMNYQEFMPDQLGHRSATAWPRCWRNARVAEIPATRRPTTRCSPR